MHALAVFVLLKDLGRAGQGPPIIGQIPSTISRPGTSTLSLMYVHTVADLIPMDFTVRKPTCRFEDDRCFRDNRIQVATWVRFAGRCGEITTLARCDDLKNVPGIPQRLRNVPNSPEM